MKILLSFCLLILITSVSEAQISKRISGKVISSEDNKPVINASVILEGSVHFTYTSKKDGSFVLNLNNDKGRIIVSCKEFETMIIPVTKDSLNMIVKLDKKVLTKDDIIAVETDKDKFGEILSDSAMISELRPIKTGLKGKSFSKKSEFSMMASESRASTIGGEGSDMGDGMMASPLVPSDGYPLGGQKASSGLLTAGEVNDFSKWQMWNDIAANDLSQYKDIWKIYPDKRFTLQIENEYHSPVFGAKVNLLENGFVIWSSYTDNTGKAELWQNPFTNIPSKVENISIEIEYKGKYYQIQQAKQFSEGMNFLRIETGCLKPNSADIVFLVDATGSMGDEINYLKMDLQAIMKDIKDTLPKIDFNLGAVFYRDTTDKYITRQSDLNSDITVTSEFINQNDAGGGGDFPEAVHRGLDAAINHLSWREDAMTKVIFLVLDAPPHTNPEVVTELQALILKASEKGIRIIPVSCSGIDKSTEYLLRSMALLTNGTYTFLTDDSGIGNPHIKPTTDKYDVETLKQLLVRLVYQYSYYPECATFYPELVNDTLDVRFPDKGGDNTLEDLVEAKALSFFKYYPNPTFGDLNIELTGEAEELFIADISGKIIFRINPKGRLRIFINISEYPSGMYNIMYQYKPDKWLKGKIVLMH